MVKRAASKGDTKPKKSPKNDEKLLSEYKSGKSRLHELFKSIKGKPSTPSSAQKETLRKARKSSAKNQDHTGGISSSKDSYSRVQVSGKTRRLTEDNLPIYTEEELNIGMLGFLLPDTNSLSPYLICLSGKGGGTDLCPFDCKCCC